MSRKRNAQPKKPRGVNYNLIFTLLIVMTIVALWILTQEPSSADTSAIISY